MEERLNILYVGNDHEAIRRLGNSPLFDFHAEPNGLLAFKWMTGGAFKPFVPYGQLQCTVNIDAVICEINGLSGIKIFHEMKKTGLNIGIVFMLIIEQDNILFKKRILSLGINGLIIKSLTDRQIFDRILYFRQKHPMHLIKPENEEVPRPYKTPLVKRIFDVFVSICALIVLSPVMLITALIIRVESRGPVIYKSKRIGSNYKTFDFYKFRSMYRDADKRLKEVIHLNQYASGSGMELICSKCAALPDGELCSPAYYYDGERICEYLAIKRQKAQKAFLKIQNDPRVTRVGKFIRNTSIDELPQLFNVLKGDMSIVGNRPLPVYEAHAITKSRWSRRFHTAAGLTGLWQVELRGRGGFMSEEERFILDNIYARKNSFLGDIVLLARTVPAIFQKTNV